MLDQPDFLNAAVRVRTTLGPEELLVAVKIAVPPTEIAAEVASLCERMEELLRAGVDLITFDVIFAERAAYERVKRARVLTLSTTAFTLLFAVWLMLSKAERMRSVWT